MATDSWRDSTAEWLTPTDYHHQQTHLAQQRSPGTCDWVLDSPVYKSWLHDDARTLLCSGEQGVGKTILASAVVQDLQAIEANPPQTDPSHPTGAVGVACIYFDALRTDEQNPKNLLLSLARQLFPVLSELVLSELADHHHPLCAMRDKHPSPELKHVVAALHWIVAKYQQAFLVLDALDACLASHRAGFLQQLSTLQSRFGLKVFVTSSVAIPEMDVLYGPSPTLEIRASDQDLHLFIAESMERLQVFAREERNVRDELVTRMVALADGRFLLAKLHLESLQSATMRITQPGTLQSHISKLPSGPEAYARAYDEAIDQCQNGQRQDLARRVLSWLTVSPNQLTLAQLQDAFALEPSTHDYATVSAEEVVAACCGLVTVYGESGIVRLIHRTARDYFAQHLPQWLSSSEAEAGAACVAYLSQARFGAGSCETEEELEDRLRCNPLYEYAAKNWGRHIGNTQLPPPPEVASFLASRPKVEAACQAAMTVRRYEATPLDCNMFAKNMSGMHVGAYIGARNIVLASLQGCAAADLVNLRDTQGQAPLSWAAQGGHAAIVELLLAEPRIDVNIRNRQGRTPLSLVAEHGHEQVARTLLDHGARANLKDVHGMVPLWHAAKAGQSGLVRLLLGSTKTSYLNLSVPQSIINRDPLDPDNNTALTTAVWNGHTEVVKILLDQENVDVRFLTHEKSTLDCRFLFIVTTDNGYEEMATHVLGKLSFSKRSKFTCTMSKEELLHRAAEKGCVKVARRLLSDHAVDPNCVWKGSWRGGDVTPLMSVGRECGGDCMVRMLLDTKGIQPELGSKNGETALSVAASRGNGAIVRVLLERTKIDINCRDNEGHTPLWHAAISGDEQVLRQLLQVPGVDPDSKDDEGRTVLWDIVFRWRRISAAMVQQLLATGRVSPDIRGPDGSTPLHRAVAWEDGGLDLVKLFLSYPETDPDAKSDSGVSPAMAAALEENWPAVALLVDTEQVDVNQQVPKEGSESPSDDGCTILGLAAATCHYKQKQAEIVSLLLSRGDTRTDIQDYHGRTPLALAAASGNVWAAKHLLAAPCVAPDTRDHEGQTALSSAASGGHVEVVRLLLSFPGITTDPKDRLGRTPLSLAAAAGFPNVVAELLAADGIDANSRDLGGRSPLWWAMPELFLEPSHDCYQHIEERKEVVRLLLLRSDVDVNAQDDEGWTPLGLALQTVRADEFLEILLSRSDLDLRHVDATGRNPLSMARDRGKAVTKMLQAALRTSGSDDGDGKGDTKMPTSVADDSIEPILANNASRPDPEYPRAPSPQESYVVRAWEQKVRIALKPQGESEWGHGDSRLCPRCEAIDLADVFSLRPAQQSGRVIADLGRLETGLAIDTCDLCRLMHAVLPRADEVDQDYQLRAFSSTNLWLCENKMKCHARFLAEWIETVFLAVVPANMSLPDAGDGHQGGYQITTEGRQGTSSESVLSAGFIGRVGSNCSYGLRSLSVCRLSTDTIDYALLRTWIDMCAQHHSEISACQPQSQVAIPHLRLIDCTSRTVHVVSPDSLVPFVALSYVWGGVQAVKGAHATDPSRPLSLDDTLVEPVVEDAILATIKLGYTHLWVDRHCVVQDDEEIRDKQLRHMNAVYQTAEVTIVAAAGQDSTFGLPGVGPRARRPQTSANVQGHVLAAIPPDPSRVVKCSKWATRGWTYQEGLLSRRRLFFTEHEVSYECVGLLCREAVALPRLVLEEEGGVFPRLQRTSRLVPTADQTSYGDGVNRTLARIVSEYTARDLTRESDILNAMLGIFQVYGTQKGGPIHHLCGISIHPGILLYHADRNYEDSVEWFVGGLAWSLSKPARRRPGFSSWSWTGWKGAVCPIRSKENVTKPEFSSTRVTRRKTRSLPASITVSRDVDDTPSDTSSSETDSDSDQDAPTCHAKEKPWLELSILEQDKPPLPWPEYMAVTNADRLSRFHQSHALQVTALAVPVTFQETTDERGGLGWRAAVCIDDEVMEGPFFLDKDPSDDDGFRRRLREESWTSILLGTRTVTKRIFDSLEVYLLVLDELSVDKVTTWERVGLARVPWYDRELRKRMFERRTFEIQ